MLRKAKAPAEVLADQGRGGRKRCNEIDNPKLHRLQGWRDRLERHTDDLAAIADWREELDSRVRRAHLTFELVDCSRREEFDALTAEVELFKQVCSALAEGKPLPERKAA
jgi:hypothetical protein